MVPLLLFKYGTLKTLSKLAFGKDFWDMTIGGKLSPGNKLLHHIYKKSRKEKSILCSLNSYVTEFFRIYTFMNENGCECVRKIRAVERIKKERKKKKQNSQMYKIVTVVHIPPFSNI